MLFAIVLLLTIGCIAFVLVRGAKGTPRPGGLRGRIRDRGWGLLLLPVAMSAAVMAGGAHGLIPAELGLAALAIVFAPKLAAKLVPYGVLGLAIEAVNFGYRVVVPRDAVAGVPADYVAALLANTFPMISTLTTTDDVLDAWESG